MHALEMAEAVGIALLKAVVGGLLSELLKSAASPAWDRNENSKILERLLAQLEPIVGSIPSTVPNTVTAWLENLRRRLESVKHLLQESSQRSQYYISKKQYSVSKNLAKENNLLNEILSVAPVLLLPLSITASADILKCCKEISEQLELLRSEQQRQDLAQVTRKALETPTNTYGKSFDLMTVGKAYLLIKNEADSILCTCKDTVIEADEQASSSELRPTHRRLDSETIFGGDEVVEDAKKLLLEENDLKVGLWASGGTGKTHAALRVFNDDDIHAHFTGGCFWLTVGRALSVEKLLCRLLALITGSSNVPRNISIEDLRNLVCMNLGRKKKMLIVLDDVWEEHVLRSLDVVPSKAGCKILVTTRNDEVLDKNHVPKLPVPLLSPENSWKLFCWQAFQVVSRVPSELETLARDVSKECGGLPLALKVIGRVFSGKTDKGFWKLSLEKLRNADVLDQDHEKQLYERLRLSVDELPTIHQSLKDCFFYFAAFPEDAKVRVYEDLLPLWIGDHVVGNRSNYDPKDEACELIGWLVSRSLIELHSEHVGSYFQEQFLSCTVHDVLRDLARYMLQHKTPVTRRECLYEAGRALDFPREWVYSGVTGQSNGRPTLSARRLSVMSTDLKTLPTKLLDAPELYVLILRDNPFTSISDTFFSNLRNIRVLDLRHTSLTLLPKSIAILKHLVVLNISFTPLAKLPDSLGTLTSLEQLMLDSCRKLSHLPGSLSSLHRLKLLTIHASSDVWKDRGFFSNLFGRKCVLQDLVSFVALEQLCISSGSQAILPAGLLTALSKLQKLDLLRFEQLRQFPDLDSKDLRYLQSLDLTGCKSLTSLPSFLRFLLLPLLHTLILSCCTGLVSLPALDGLPNLVKLDLSDCSGLASLPATFGRRDGFPALEELRLFACDKIASFPELEDGAMPCLKFLELSGWSQKTFDSLPKTLARLKHLRFLGLSLCFNLKSLEHDHLTFLSFADLEELTLDYCPVSRLPETLAQLPKLRLLSLKSCNASIPENLQQAIANGRIKLR